MNIILEGCDKTGKTTLAKMCCQYFKLEYKHFAAPPKDLSKDAQIAYQKAEYAIETLMLPYQNACYDRFLIGEAVYSPIYRGYCPDYIHVFEKAFPPEDTFLFLIYADPKIVADRFDGKFIKKEHIPKILKSFQEQFRKSKIKNKFAIDTTIESPKESFNTIMTYVNLIQWGGAL